MSARERATRGSAAWQLSLQRSPRRCTAFSHKGGQQLGLSGSVLGLVLAALRGEMHIQSPSSLLRSPGPPIAPDAFPRTLAPTDSGCGREAGSNCQTRVQKVCLAPCDPPMDLTWAFFGPFAFCGVPWASAPLERTAMAPYIPLLASTHRHRPHSGHAAVSSCFCAVALGAVAGAAGSH